MSISDEKIEAIRRMNSYYEPSLDGHEEIADQIRTLLTAIRERESTIAGLTNDALSLKLQLEQANRSVAELRKDTPVGHASWRDAYDNLMRDSNDCISALRTELADLRLQSGVETQRRKEAEMLIHLEREDLSKARQELAELRKPVAVEANVRQAFDHLTILVSFAYEQGYQELGYCPVRELMQAYDALAQQCAGYANSHVVLMAEREVARKDFEFVDRLWKEARTEADQRADQMEQLQERELQLRDGLHRISLHCLDSHAVRIARAALAASPPPVESEQE